MRPSRRLVVAAVLLAFVATASGGALAAETDPAVTVIDNFDQALIATMKQADALGVKGRYRKLAPAVERTFDLKTMAHFAVGTSWNGLSEADRGQIVEAFTRLSVANYAHNFDGYNGERFEVDPAVDVRGQDKIVKTKLVAPGSAPVALNYRMRALGGSWKVIDVLFQGTISQMTTRRSDLAQVSATGDAKAIAANLNAQADKLLAK